MATYTELPIMTTDAIESVDLIANLPVSGVTAGSVRYVAENQKVYVYDGSSWALV